MSRLIDAQVEVALLNETGLSFAVEIAIREPDGWEMIKAWFEECLVLNVPASRVLRTSDVQQHLDCMPYLHAEDLSLQMRYDLLRMLQNNKSSGRILDRNTQSEPCIHEKIEEIESRAFESGRLPSHPSAVQLQEEADVQHAELIFGIHDFALRKISALLKAKSFVRRR